MYGLQFGKKDIPEDVWQSRVKKAVKYYGDLTGLN